MSVFADGTGVTEGTQNCRCGADCEFPCWQRLGLAPACRACGCGPLDIDDEDDMPPNPGRAAMRLRREKPTRTLTGNCPIREHTGDGAYVGRCDFAVYNGVCPRHGVVADYPNRDDRDISRAQRRFAAQSEPQQPGRGVDR